MNTVTIRPAISGTGHELDNNRTGAAVGAVVMWQGRAYVRDAYDWRGPVGPLTYLTPTWTYQLIYMPDGTGRHRKNVGPVESKLSFPFEPWRGRHSR